jgi:hypothetical protein
VTHNFARSVTYEVCGHEAPFSREIREDYGFFFAKKLLIGTCKEYSDRIPWLRVERAGLLRLPPKLHARPFLGDCDRILLISQVHFMTHRAF